MTLSTVQTTTQFAYIDALKAKLDARLPGAQVTSAPIDPGKATEPDLVMIVGTTMTEAFVAHSNRRVDEEYTVSLEFASMRPGADESVMVEVRGAVQGMLAELEDELRSNFTMDGLVLWSRIATVDITQGFGDNGRICVLSVTIAVRARLAAS